MKRLISVLAPSALALAMLSACGSTQAPAELRDARAAYGRAQSAPAAQANRAGLMDARQALDAAEREYNTSPGSDDVKTLAYVARRKAEIAEADGRTAMARAQQQDAEKQFLQLQTAQAQREAEKHRQAADVSARRAKIALERLGLAAKDEPRGTVITLPGASMFATNKAEIRPDAKQRLAEIADAVKQAVAERAPQDKGRAIMLIGYTDSTGSDEHNMDLSKRRADAVRAFFSERGLDPAMMVSEGRGEADPIGDNETPQGRTENRRVEIVITPPASGTSMMPAEPSGEEKAKGATESTPAEATTPAQEKPKSTTPSETPNK